MDRSDAEAGAGNALADQAHQKADATHHYWVNLLAHGADGGYPSGAFYKWLDYLYSHYGPGGTDEVWVAPSDAVYSYLLVREQSRVTRQ